MIKRIIFDIDNTLLDTTKDCLTTYQNYFSKYNMKLNPKSLYNLIDQYEKEGHQYLKSDLENYINNHLNISMNLEDILNMYSKHATILDSNIPNTLAYLSQKYELVALSNWYY